MSDSIARLYRAVLDASDENPALSRTARLKSEGVNKMAKKVAEEAAEVAIEAVTGARESLIRESADLIYNLVVLWSASDVSPQDVYDEMDRRERLYGLAQKLPKADQIALAQAERAPAKKLAALAPAMRGK
ncbi:phosphoribosyl-ATP diphosphatase [Chelatococcus sambhunathii]|uniref:Phosphoribosyl-ATP pyrophosphatase n=1 Tax=Chelatococcus sambhunathii TaxID=363953 RepID=A0ABU1DJ98_9HYPH|nr:phosphoribosyl-ATP diphosphatase [Chelatococcus sambhunathii]MDR4308169.1 phosphoribosyl-ATP diphosphatase [Chelatococcus sambhunathii]